VVACCRLPPRHLLSRYGTSCCLVRLQAASFGAFGCYWLLLGSNWKRQGLLLLWCFRAWTSAAAVCSRVHARLRADGYHLSLLLSWCACSYGNSNNESTSLLPRPIQMYRCHHPLPLSCDAVVDAHLFVWLSRLHLFVWHRETCSVWSHLYSSACLSLSWIR